MTAVPVLLYHGVSPTTSDRFGPYVIAPATFEAHLDLIAATAPATLTVSQFVSAMTLRRPIEPGTVVVTFDDGFADFGRHALGPLRDRSIAATLYVPTAHIGGTAEWLASEGEQDRALLNADELRLLDGAIEIGAHSHTHAQLDLLPPTRLEEEVRTSKRILEAELGHEVHSFAYPHGFHDSRVRRAVIEAGFRSACAVKNACSSTEDDPFAIARVTVTSDVDLAQLARWLECRDIRRASRRERLVTRAHRLARRARRGRRRPSSRR